jgi:hypothetical protein
MLFEKMFSMEGVSAGTAKVEVKDEQMLKTQEEIMAKIEADRMRLRDMRDSQGTEDKV